jgi:diguanylate cyclase (GGDEF)-like protein
MDFWLKLSVRVRLILLFIGIKVVPLVLLVYVAWYQTEETAAALGTQIETLVSTADEAIHRVGNLAIDDAVDALDAHARDEIERLATDTAGQVADFLYSRDADILLVAGHTPDEAMYRNYIEKQRRILVVHGNWRLNAAGTDWEPETALPGGDYIAEPGSNDNVTSFHYRPPAFFKAERRPLYLEMTFVGLDGKERIKATSSPLMNPALQDISQRSNTFAKAETYFPELQKLKPGEIYVSDVIGSYVGSQIIGKFTPAAAEQRGIAFEPEKHAYAGKENPGGKRFQGIVRWATPVTKDDKIIGWVTLALDHDHLMAFTDHIVPTNERYRDINDAFNGNYAFIWDYKGRSIVHPRHHSIVGYDENGEPHVPWLEGSVYEDWQKSGKSWREFMETAPTFVDQRQSRKAAPVLTAQGDVGLDCRWLNFAPQCIGWYNLADQGGSGSFLILWSGLWKLTTVAAIPYYTGQYSPDVAGNKRGFGIVTIGANVADFHRAATDSKERLDAIIKTANGDMKAQGEDAGQALRDNMTNTSIRLLIVTLILIVAVVVIAIWMASFLSKKLGWLNDGFNRFRLGEKAFRFKFGHHDEITSLAGTFNEMADTLNQNVARLEQEIQVRTHAESELRDIRDNLEVIVEERTRELSEANHQLSEEIHVRREAEEKAQYLAGHDPLTGLANRMLFNEQLQRAIFQSTRSGKYGALLFFDLDHFKKINDTLGHAAGDALLVHMSNVLKERVRKTDTAARLGGDEFAVIMTEMEQAERAAILAEDILNMLHQPIILGEHKILVRTSIGIATFQGEKNGKDPEEIIKNADMAMYLSKTEGGMRYKFFEQAVQEKLHADVRLERELRTALDKRQFVPYFQPLFHTTQRRVLYLEVLARWQHPVRGPLLPGEFIGVAEHSGLMLEEVDSQILHLACSQAKDWLEDGLFDGRISVNILPRYLEQADFALRVQDILDAHQLPARHLSFELAEYALLNNSSQSSITLAALRKMGIEIIVDRLEVERSALKNLFDYPIDAIKIDRAFTSQIGDPKVNAVIGTISALAHTMDIGVIAEGVENETQWDFFTTLHCEIIQGYKHAKPMSSEDTQKYLGECARGAA